VNAAPVHTKEEIEGVIAAQAQPGGGLIVMPDAFTTANSDLISALAAQYKVSGTITASSSVPRPTVPYLECQ
jgi:hypothetical protein